LGGKKLPPALNEAELVTPRLGNVIEYWLRVNGKLKLRDRGDGVIIATPTGSTAHAYSAGGMKISPKKRVFEIVPINSMYNRGRVMAVPDNAKLSLSRFTKGSEVLIDGKVRVKAGKSVLLKKGEPALFLRPL
ncbi:NAD(+)/NADH kinase, partial [Candidatus Micrarchaeota archaeon]|nr:NAD(+)/NADH kinase [Candidatus Micrarchaeota archaeon]